MTEREAINLLEDTCTISDLSSIEDIFSSTYIFHDNIQSSIITTHEASHADIIEYCLRAIDELKEEDVIVDNISNDMFYSVVKTNKEDHFAFITINNSDNVIIDNVIDKLIKYINQDYTYSEIKDRTYDELRNVYYLVIKF